MVLTELSEEFKVVLQNKKTTKFTATTWVNFAECCRLVDADLYDVQKFFQKTFGVPCILVNDQMLNMKGKYDALNIRMTMQRFLNSKNELINVCGYN